MEEAREEAVPERELRLALVCYGGVSLAVYMHGITREVLKLVRASRALHAIPESETAQARYEDAGSHRGELDTERVYFRLLREIAGQVRLRVIVDVIAGASAGGINGIMLARALAYDLSLDGHRELWLELADVGELLDPHARAGRFSKFYMRPLFWFAKLLQRRRARKLGLRAEDPDVLRNLSLFMRSRWFEPPFSGRRMAEMMLEALHAVGEEESGATASLLPPGLPLELYVTATNFWGHPQTIPLHDPAEVREREHRHIFHFHHWFTRSGACHSQLGAEQMASLAFAARATSSFPGAFPPARLAEMDALLAERKESWGGRDTFVAEQFRDLNRAGEDPEDAAFIDGSVLMNKPVSLALDAVQRHVAHRQVDRRLVYLEPNPEVEREVAHEIPGFFKTIKGALSDIPRHQPIRDDLDWIARFNDQVSLHRQVVEAVRPKVLGMMGSALDDVLGSVPGARQLGDWRRAANNLAAADAGYSYEGYARLKVLGLLEELGDLFQRSTRGLTRTEAQARIAAWARSQGIRPMGEAGAGAQGGIDPPWVTFLRQYDVRHRLRRVLLLIRRTNELYTDGGEPCTTGCRRELDRLKIRLYAHAERLRSHLDWRSLRLESPGPDLGGDYLNAFLVRLRERLDLLEMDDRLDTELTEWCEGLDEPTLMHEILTAYLGFAYYDVLTYPMAQTRDLDVLEEIKVDRIAVDDANTLREGSAREVLKGVQFGNFGAFFSRRFRENDYLWGRLTAAERLVDIVGSAVPEAVATGLDLRAIKRDLFLAILEAERPHLEGVDELIDALETDALALK